MGFDVKCELFIPNSRQVRMKHICIQSGLNTICHWAYKVTHLHFNDALTYYITIVILSNQNKPHNKLMATVNQAVVNPLLDAPAKARGHLIVTRRKVANKVTHSFLSMSAFSLSLLLFFEVFTK